MNQDFRSRYNEILDNDPTGPAPEPGAESDSYASHGHTRNLGFVWPDGRKMFLNYSYLVSGEYLPEQGRIVLSFTTHAVRLDGIRLETLFDELMSHAPRLLRCTEVRYNSLEDEKPVINLIEITGMQ